MISTAILMKIGADQASVHPASTDRGETDGISFAQSFDERVGGATEMLGDRPASQVATVQMPKDEPPMNVANEVFAVLPEVKGKTVVAGRVPEYAEAGGPASGRIVPSRKVGVLGPQVETAVGDSEVKNVQSPANAERATEGSSDIPEDEKALSFKNDVFLLQVNTEDRLLAPSSEEIVVKKGTTRTSTTLGTVATERNGKSQLGKAATPVLQKIGPLSHPVAIEVRPSFTTVAQGADHSKMGNTIEALRMSVVGANAAPVGEPTSTSDGHLGGGVSVAGKSLLVGATATKDSLVQKYASGGVDVETASPVVADQMESAKGGAGVGKLLSAAMPASGDSDGRTESTSGFATTVAHAMAGNAAVASDIVTPGNGTRDASVMTLVSAETGGHMTGLPVGFREQDSSGRVGVSLDRTPQMLTATPTALEVGIQNGTHGWLKVRAEMTDTGAVNASVSAASTSGQEMLHRELPSLTAYLQSEKVAVNAVVVHATAVESRGSAADMDSGSGGQTQYRGDDGGGDHKRGADMALNGTNEAASYESLNVVDDNGALPLATYESGGSWLSIRA